MIADVIKVLADEAAYARNFTPHAWWPGGDMWIKGYRDALDSIAKRLGIEIDPGELYVPTDESDVNPVEYRDDDDDEDPGDTLAYERYREARMEADGRGSEAQTKGQEQ